MLDVPGYVLAVSFAPDGRSLAASGSDQQVRIWETESGNLIHQLAVDTSFSAENGRRSATFAGDFVSSLTFSNDGKFLLTSGPGGTRVWEAATGKKLNLLPELLRDRLAAVDHSALSADGRLLAVTSPQGVIGIWDWGKSKEALKVQAHPGRIRSIAFSPDGKTLASLADGAIRQWDVVTGRPQGDQTGHQEGVASVAYALDGSTILTAGQDGTVRQWRAQTGKEIRRWEVPPSDIEKAHISPLGMRQVVVSPNGKFIAAVRGDWVVVAWDAASAKEVYRFPSASCVTFSPDGKLMAYGEIAAQKLDPSGVIHVLELGTGKELMNLPGHLTQISSLAVVPDGKTLISCGVVLHGMNVGGPQETNYIRFWDLVGGKERPIHLAESHARGLALSPDGRILAATGNDESAGSIRLWQAATGRLRGQVTVAGRYLSTAAFSPDGHRLAFGDFDGVVWLLDTDSGKVLVRLAGHAARVLSVAFSPDGKSLVSGSGDTTALVWDVSRFAQRGE